MWNTCGVCKNTEKNISRELINLSINKICYVYKENQ